jgi:hypothetical protein
MDVQSLLNSSPTFVLPLTPERQVLDLQESIYPTLLTQANTQSWASPNSLGPLESLPTLPPPQTPQRSNNPHTTRSDRIRIKTALDFNVPVSEITRKYGFTARQIQVAKRSRNTPQKHSCGRKPFVSTPRRQRLEQWLLESPSRRHLAYHAIPSYMPDMQGYGTQAIRSAFKLNNLGRRVAVRKGFSDDPEVKAERLQFAREGLTWSRQRLNNQMFSDEVWAHGGAHTQSYVTVKLDGTDRLENTAHKYGKQPA